MPFPLRSLVAIAVAVALTGCVAEVTPPRARIVVPAPEVYVPPPPRPVVSVYVEPPISQPAPIAIGWAPPPLLIESPPPPPFDGAVWVGGYWVWEGDWVWAHGHWVSPPRPEYVWVHPYYENRGGVVLFITGHWSAPGVAFVPPPPGIHLSVEIAAVGVVPGPRPIGDNGCFVPAPPGSRLGIIVPAPIGTAPAVVTGAPPVVAVGMRITNNVNNTTNNVTNVKNVTNITNVKNVTNVTNVTIVAPPSATASGQAVNTSVPAQAHLAAAQPAVFKAQAPEPVSTKPIPAFVHGKPPAQLPPAQVVHAPPPAPVQAHANPQAHQDTAHGPQNKQVNQAKPQNQPAESRPAESPSSEGTKHPEPVARADRPPPKAGGPGEGNHPVAANTHAESTGDAHGHPVGEKPDAHKPANDKPVNRSNLKASNDRPSGQPKAKAGDHPKKPNEKEKGKEKEREKPAA